MQKQPSILSEHLAVHSQVTLYFLDHLAGPGRAGVETVECLDCCHELRYSTSHEACVAVEYRKTKRSRPTFQQFGRENQVVILEGWGHPHFQNWMPSGNGRGARATARFGAFSEEWTIAFAAFLDELRDGGAKVIADYRERHLMRHAPNGRRLLAAKTLKDYEFASADEISTLDLAQPETFSEGSATSVIVNKYERDPSARRRCIEHFGPTCQVCGIDFSKAYPGVGEGFIHVHHLVPLSAIGCDYSVNPIVDLIPVCPNCHAMIHIKTPPFAPEEIKTVLGHAARSLAGDDDLPF